MALRTLSTGNRLTTTTVLALVSAVRLLWRCSGDAARVSIMARGAAFSESGPGEQQLFVCVTQCVRAQRESGPAAIAAAASRARRCSRGNPQN